MAHDRFCDAAVRREAEAELAYRLVLKAGADGVRQVQVLASSDEAALNGAISRLGEASVIDVWRHARWVGRVQRG